MQAVAAGRYWSARVKLTEIPVSASGEPRELAGRERCLVGLRRGFIPAGRTAPYLLGHFRWQRVELLFLVVGQQVADLGVGFLADAPDLVPSLIARNRTVFHDGHQLPALVLQNRPDLGYLVHGEIQLVGKHLDIFLHSGHTARSALAALSLSLPLRRWLLCRSQRHQAQTRDQNELHPFHWVGLLFAIPGNLLRPCRPGKITVAGTRKAQTGKSGGMQEK